MSASFIERIANRAVKAESQLIKPALMPDMLPQTFQLPETNFQTYPPNRLAEITNPSPAYEANAEQGLAQKNEPATQQKNFTKTKPADHNSLQ